MNTPNGNGSGKVRVTFAHPRDSSKKEMEVGPDVTAKKAIDGLVALNFIAPVNNERNYVLSIHRTGKQIPATEKLSAAGVVEGDVVVMTQSDVGGAGS